MKKAEDAPALIFRMYESTGTPTDVHLHIPPGSTYAIETNLMEAPISDAPHLPITGDTVTIPIKPYEILTLQVVYPDPTAAK
jgi:alpha-mannosidase